MVMAAPTSGAKHTWPGWCFQSFQAATVRLMGEMMCPTVLDLSVIHLLGAFGGVKRWGVFLARVSSQRAQTTKQRHSSHWVGLDWTANKRTLLQQIIISLKKLVQCRWGTGEPPEGLVTYPNRYAGAGKKKQLGKMIGFLLAGGHPRKMEKKRTRSKKKRESLPQALASGNVPAPLGQCADRREKTHRGKKQKKEKGWTLRGID